MPSNAMEDYVAAVWRLTQHGGPATTSEVARRLKVSAASTSHMFKKMAESGLVEHREYVGATLTELGQRAAAGYIRRHRLTERFLVDILGIPWDQVDDIADRMEHSLPELVLERIDQILGSPTTCPHGHPVPSTQGVLPDLPVRPLRELAAGETGTVGRVLEHDPSLLSYLLELDLTPGTPIAVQAWGPMGETVTLSIGGHDRVVGTSVIQAVFVNIA